MLKTPVCYNPLTNVLSERHDDAQTEDWHAVIKKQRSHYRLLVTEKDLGSGWDPSQRRVAYDPTLHRLVTHTELQLGAGSLGFAQIQSSKTDPRDHENRSYLSNYLFGTNGYYSPTLTLPSRPFLRNGKYYSVFVVRPETDPYTVDTPRKLYMLSWRIQDPAGRVPDPVGSDRYPDLDEACNSPKLHDRYNTTSLADVIQLPSGRILLSALSGWNDYLGYKKYSYNLIILDENGQYISRSTIHARAVWHEPYPPYVPEGYWEYTGPQMYYPTLLADGSVSWWGAASRWSSFADSFSVVSDSGEELWMTPAKLETDAGQYRYPAAGRTADGRALLYATIDADPYNQGYLHITNGANIVATRYLGTYDMGIFTSWGPGAYSEATQYWYICYNNPDHIHLDIYRTRTLDDLILWRSCTPTDFPNAGSQNALHPTVWIPSGWGAGSTSGPWCTDDGKGLYVGIAIWDSYTESFAARNYLIDLDDATKPIHASALEFRQNTSLPSWGWIQPFVRSRGCLQA